MVKNKENQQQKQKDRKKVQFIVTREFSGSQMMREAFEQLIDTWGGARISHILRTPFYKGAHLVCRTHQKGIRSNTYDIIPPVRIGRS